MDKSKINHCDQDFLQPSITMIGAPTATVSLSPTVTVPEVGEAIGRGIGGFIGELFAENKKLTKLESKNEELKIKNEKLETKNEKLETKTEQLKASYDKLQRENKEFVAEAAEVGKVAV